MYLFSKSTLGFYPEASKEDYVKAGSLPDDVIEVSDEVRDEYNFSPPAGKKLGVDAEGHPVWVSRTKQELIENALTYKQFLNEQAVAFITSKQWPGKAALGRLKDDEKEQYGIWLDYLDALEALDVTAAPDLNWPATPA
ncbi:tail fiber assembly protein [Kosakonia sacchari]|uniref:tail fiber assembly protein n=1 Tax=Kosakonia sacchari TaxID=1158459 RepID=UPI0015859F20|nr:tail fiber assembly protein [Kosakonia sacchari]NUL36315.1 tail fiber assembly protein [Kosakonia sacchari]